jgi:CHAT domain-containing protein
MKKKQHIVIILILGISAFYCDAQCEATTVAESSEGGNSLDSQVKKILSRKSNLVGFVDPKKQPEGETDEIINKKRELQNRIQSYGPDSISASIGYDNLAQSLKHRGMTWEAEKYSKKSLNTIIPITGMNNNDVAITIDNLGSLYSDVGNFVDSLPLRLKAVELFENINGASIKDIALARENLGVTYMKLGDMDKGIEFLKKSSELYPQIGGMPTESQSYFSMAWAYNEKGDYKTSEKYYRKAFEYKQQTMSEDSGNSKKHVLWMIKRGLAQSLARQGKTAEAKTIILGVVQDVEVGIDCDDPCMGETYCDAGEVEFLSGNYVKAREYYAKGMEIYRRLLSPSHTFLVAAEKQLIISLVRSGKLDYAKKITKIWKTASDQNINNIITCGTESQRLVFLQNNLNFNLPASVFSPDELANCLLNWKGVVLDSIINDRKDVKLINGDSGQKDFNELRRINQSIMNIEMNAGVTAGNESGKRELLSEKMAIERRLYTKTKDDKESARTFLTYKQVQESMPPDSATIDIIEYNPINSADSSSKYAAILTLSTGVPLRFDLGDVSVINKMVENLRSLILESKDNSEAYYNASVDFIDTVWKPIEKSFPPYIKKLFISPSGQVSFISFSSLVDDKNNFLGERYDINYISSSKDLLNPSITSKDGDFIIFNNPDFSAKLSDNKVIASSKRGVGDALLSVSFSQLPGTQREGEEIEKIASNMGCKVLRKSGSDASKANIEKIEKPRVLHLATHGFFLGSQDSVASTDRGMMVLKKDSHEGSSAVQPAPTAVDTSAFDKNPMRQSGLALAGAQDTVTSWALGLLPPPENNGILTAEDVSMLDLRNTWLVTLSACESGVGQSKSGEGVFGLRRAFMMAGAQNLLMTLWPVSDEVTPKIMADFYGEALKTGDAAGSLAKVQRDWLVKLRQEKGLQAAVRDAGPFAMVAMSKPNQGKSEAIPPPAEQPSIKPTELVPTPPTLPTAPPYPSPIPVQAHSEKSGLKKAA